MKTALIIVDVHKFFLHDAPSSFADTIANHIKNETYDLIVFTVFKNNSKSNFVQSLNWKKCVETKDLELPIAFDYYVRGNNVFTRAAYSGFSSTTLHKYLTENKIEKVVLCGIDTDACVLATAFNAFDKGYLVDVKFDLTFSGGNLQSEAQSIIKRSLLPRN